MERNRTLMRNNNLDPLKWKFPFIYLSIFDTKTFRSQAVEFRL